MTDAVGFAIVGCGVIGRSHARFLQDVPGARLIAVADVIPERARDLAEAFGCDWYSSTEELLKRDDVEVVDVCTISGLHADVAIPALEAGKHVIVEKPLEITVERCNEIIAAAEKAGRKLATVYQYRFEAPYRKMRAAVQEGKLGRVVLADMHMKAYRSQAYFDAGGWRGTWKYDGGGALMNQGIHFVDQLQWIMGGVAAVKAYSDHLVHRIETEDTAVAAVRFRNGAFGVIEATTAAFPGLWNRLEFTGDRGSIVLENGQFRVMYWAEGEEELEVGHYGRRLDLSAEPSRDIDIGPWPEGVPGHVLQLRDMVEAVREDRPPFVDGYAGREAVAIIRAIYESAQTGEEVVIEF
ncbi:MAG: Gfo/Idh/MocA family oxidoreductase [Anaerolineae bacterium]